MSGFFSRVARAAWLEPDLYEEVEADHGATGQALLVVLLSALASAVGALGAVRPPGGLGGAGVIPVFVVAVVAALLAWLVEALVAFGVGGWILPERQTEADAGQLLRAVGFSSAPGLLRVFGAIPVLGPAVFILTGLWMLVAMVVAVRQALDYTTTWRALVVAVVAWGAYLALTLAFVGFPRA